MIVLTAISLPFMLRTPIDLPPIISVELIQIMDKTNIPFAPKAKKIIQEAKKKEEAMALKVDQTNASNRQKMIARRAATPTAVPAPPIFNAPTTVSAPSTTNVSSTTTTLSNNDRVIDSLSFVT